MKNKTVLIAARHPVGGIYTFFRYIYSHTQFSEFNYIVVIPESEDNGQFPELFGTENIEVVTFTNSMDFFLKVLKYLYKRNVNLLHSHGFSTGIILSGIYLFSRVPHLMTAHDIFQQRHFTGIKGTFKKNLLRFSFSLIDRIHTVGEEATVNFFEFYPGFKRKKVTCIRNAIDTEKYYVQPDTRLDKLLPNRDKKEYIIGFFGRFMSQKGFKYLIYAVREITKYPELAAKVKVHTYGWGGFIREDYEYIEKLGLAQYFEQKPGTDDMPGALAKVDIVAMPSLWEACPLLAMEVLVAGKPIVGTNCMGLNEILITSPAQIIDIEDAQALAESIINEYEWDREKEFIDFSSEANELFAIDAQARQLRMLYDEMIRV